MFDTERYGARVGSSRIEPGRFGTKTDPKQEGDVDVPE